MPEEDDTTTPGHEPQRPHPPGWTPSDAWLEARLEEDERRLAEEEKEVKRNWALVLAVALILGVTVAALIVSVIALNRDIEAVAKAEPKDDSVGTAALEDGAVTSEKLAGGAVGAGQLAEGAVTAAALAEASVAAAALAPGAVTSPALAPQAVVNAALAPESVGTKKLIDGAVTGAKVEPDTLTGVQIREATLEAVPEALQAAEAEQADNSARLGGKGASAYLSGVELAQASSEEDLTAVKQVEVSCPGGTFVIGGGAAIGEALQGVAIVANAPSGESGWVAVAVAVPAQRTPWQLTATVICAAGGR
jgi:hypothetical protein